MICLDRYEITKDGKVYDKKRNNVEVKTHIITGYQACCIYDENKVKHILLVHRLVAQKYLSNYTDNCVVHHIDENKMNNNVNNLVCMTPKEHMQHHKIKYHEKKMICPVCKNEFIWTVSSQIYHAYRGDKGPFCSSSCAIRYASTKRKIRPVKNPIDYGIE